MTEPDPFAQMLALLEGGAQPIGPVRIGVTLGIALILGSAIAGVYAVRGPRPTPNGATALVGLSLVTALVILPISSNITLSLGMVGALSIVRFRAAIKDPLDIVFMFWAIAVGIATGAGFFGVSALGSAIIAAVLLLAGVLPTGLGPTDLLIVRYAPDAEGRLQPLLPRHRLRSRTQDRELVELVIELRRPMPGEKLATLTAIDGVRDAQLVSAAVE